MVSVDIGATRVLATGVISKYVLENPDANAFAAGAALTKEFIDERPEVAAGFARAWERALEDIANDTDAVRAYLVGNTFTSEEIAPRIPMVNYLMVSDLSDENIANFQKFIDLATNQGVLKENVPVADFLIQF